MTSNIPKICAKDLVKDIFQDGVESDSPEEWKFGNYFRRFKSFCLTECVSEGSNRPNDKKCNHCGAVHMLVSADLPCKHWILKKTILQVAGTDIFEESEYLQEEVARNNEEGITAYKHYCESGKTSYKGNNVCLSCKKKCDWIYIHPRLGTMTINIYWQNARKVIQSLPYIDTLSVSHLAKKNSEAFAKRCQQLYGSYKNQQDNLAETRENVVRPSILKFIEFLRYEIGFDFNDEDDSHDEVSYCVGCRCGHKDCLGLDCACHTMVDVEVNGKIVRVNKCNGLSMVCFQCNQKFAICEFNKYITLLKNDKHLLTDTINFQGMKCNRCFMRSCVNGNGFSFPNEIASSMRRVEKKAGRYSQRQMIVVKKKEGALKRKLSYRSISLDDYDNALKKVREEADEGVITEQDNVNAFIKAHKVKAKPIRSYYDTHKTLPNLLREIKDLKEKVNEIDNKSCVQKVWDNLFKRRRILQGEEKATAEMYVKYFAKSSHEKEKVIDVDMKENEFFVKIHKKSKNQKMETIKPR